MNKELSEYERGVIDGRQIQMQSSVDKAVNAMSDDTSQIFYSKFYPAPQRTWVGLTDEELPPLAGDNGKYMELQQVRRFYKYIEAKLKEKNT